MYSTNQKICISGRVLEVFTYEKTLIYGFQSKRPRNSGGVRRVASEQDDVTLLNSIRRAKGKMRRLSDANILRWKNRKTGKPCLPIFITFTFALNITDTTEAHRLFSKAIMRFNNHWKKYLSENLKYIAVPERQQRGAIHYHMVIYNLPKIPNIYDDVRKIWSHGIVRVESVKQPHVVTRYLMKYFSKDLKSGRDFNGKRYFRSNGLYEPIVIMEEERIEKILEQIPVTCKPYVGKPIQSEWQGQIDYTVYWLPKDLTIPGIYKDVNIAQPTSQEEPDRPLPLNN